MDNVLPKVAPAFFMGAVIAYADNTQYKHHRKMLGVAGHKTPALSINNNEQKVLPFPEDQELTEDNIAKWLSKFVQGKLAAKTMQFGEIIDAEIKYMMPEAEQLRHDNFVDKVYEQEQDALVFIYSSATEDEVQRMVAKRFNELAQRFAQMKISTVSFYCFDRNTDGHPPRVETMEAPLLLFFPAFHKRPPYPKFMSEPKVSEMAGFVKKYADREFSLSIDIAQQEQF